MPLRSTTLAALLGVLALLLTAPAGRAAAVKGLPQTGVTVSPIRPGFDPAAFAAQLDAVKATGAGHVRTEIEWQYVEPTAPGQRDEAFLAVADQAVQAASARGLQVLLTIDGTPCWATTAPAASVGDCTSAAQREEAARFPPADPARFAELAAALAARWHADLAGIELWNEPDQANEHYWAGPDKPARYAALTKAAYPAIKAAAPGVPVLAGALVGADGTFLKALYAEGFKGTYDLLSVHYYDLVLAAVRAIRTTQRAAGDPAPLWLGEFGWDSCLRPDRLTQGGHDCVTQAVQARNTRDVLRSLRGTSYVRGATLYAVQDSPALLFGLLDLAGRPKPLLAAVRDALTKPGKPSRVQLRLTTKGSQLVASGRGPAGDVLRLDVFRGRTQRYRALLRTDRHDRFSVTLPRALGTRGLQVRVYSLWLGGGTLKRT